MFFKWRKEYYKLLEQLERVRKYNREFHEDNERLSIITSNLDNILGDDEVISTSLYKNNDTFYCIAEKRLKLPDLNYEIYYHTYNLSDIALKPITSLESKVSIREENISIRLDNIDTMYQKCEGHASRQIAKLIKYGKDIGAIKITGELWKGTSIGIENLKRFYLKNGFEVNDRMFFMSL